MHKDVLIFLPEHEKKAKRIADIYLEQTYGNGHEGILCISGLSGTGKSEVAWFVARQLYKRGISSHVVNLDRFYKVPIDERDQWRKEHGYIGHDEMDWTRVDEEISRFGNSEIRVLIFEGLYAGYIDGMTFYLEGDIESTHEFRRSRGKEDEDDEWRKFVVAKEYEDILRGMKFYDYRIE